jgi:hypothetical protein
MYDTVTVIAAELVPLLVTFTYAILFLDPGSLLYPNGAGAKETDADPVVIASATTPAVNPGSEFISLPASAVLAVLEVYTLTHAALSVVILSSIYA